MTLLAAIQQRDTEDSEWHLRAAIEQMASDVEAGGYRLMAEVSGQLRALLAQGPALTETPPTCVRDRRWLLGVVAAVEGVVRRTVSDHLSDCTCTACGIHDDVIALLSAPAPTEER